MSLDHDQLEDSYIFNEFSEASEEKEKKKPCYLCKCCFWNPCCRFCASKFLRGDLKRTFQNIDNLPAGGRADGGTFGTSKLRATPIETGLFSDLKSIREKRNKENEYTSMEEIRNEHKLKVTIPKLKTKNAKTALAQVHRRAAHVDSELNLPKDVSKLNKDAGYLAVMDDGRKKVPMVLEALIFKTTLNDIPLPVQKKQSLLVRSGLIGSSHRKPSMFSSSHASTVFSQKSRNQQNSFLLSMSPENQKDMAYYSGKTVKELEKNWHLTIPYIKNWISTHQKSIRFTEMKGKYDRWVVVFYTSSDPMDEFSEFGCLLVRELFIHYCIAYEEKDISVEKNNYRNELQNRLNGGTILIPYVFVSNAKLGGCRVIWALHRLNLIHEVFSNYMVNPKIYDLWRFEVQPMKVDLMINVPLKEYPSLEVISQGQKARLNSEKLKCVQDGKEIVKQSKEKWRLISSLQLMDMNLYMFVIIKETIKTTFTEMDVTFWNALFPQKPYTNTKQMKAAIAKYVKK